MQKRHNQIVQIVSEKKKISVAQLSKEIGVSVVTVRHDLSALERDHYLKREHGFAIAIQEPDDTESRLQVNMAVKQALAGYAAQLVEENDTVFIEGGSTNAVLARLLSHRADVTIITMNVYIAHLLKESKCNVILLGGMVQKQSEATLGPITRAALKMVHFNKSFIGVDGYTTEHGFTGRDMLRADILNSVIAKCNNNIILSDSSKFGRTHLNALSPMDRIHQVITDQHLDQHYKTELAERLILSIV
jgi:DeoR/GlpR family transcriptional regulator of sugar metabolism